MSSPESHTSLSPVRLSQFDRCPDAEGGPSPPPTASAADSCGAKSHPNRELHGDDAPTTKYFLILFTV